MAGVHVEGSRKIALVGRALRQMGTDRSILNEMTKQIRQSAPPLRDEIRQSARTTLPRRGGLGEWVARARINVSVKRGATTAGVYVNIGKNSIHGRTDLQSLDAGTVRHPLWGKRKYWYPQAVTPGFASRVIDGPAFDRFQADAEQAIDVAVERALRGI